VNDAIGGKAFYLARVELEVPVTASIKSMGLRPSVYVDAGSLWSITKPPLIDVVAFCSPVNTSSGLASFNSSKSDCSFNQDTNQPVADKSLFAATPGFKEVFLGNSPKPRVSIGVGVNWISPFGPLRLDLAKAIVFQKGDDPKLFTFNVGTAF